MSIAIETLQELMRATLETWGGGRVPLPPSGELLDLAGALRDAYLIDNESHALLQRLDRWAHPSEPLTPTERLQAQGLLEELLALFRSLRSGPTLGKRHDAIVPRWLAGESIAALAESRGTDEQRILVLLHEVARYYNLPDLTTLSTFLRISMDPSEADDHKMMTEWLGFSLTLPPHSEIALEGSSLARLTLPLAWEAALAQIAAQFEAQGFALSEVKSLPDEGKYRFIGQGRKFYLVRRSDPRADATELTLADVSEQAPAQFQQGIARLLAGESASESGTLDLSWEETEQGRARALHAAAELLATTLSAQGFRQHASSLPDEGIYLYTGAGKSVEAQFFASIEDPYNQWGDGIAYIITLRPLDGPEGDSP